MSGHTIEMDTVIVRATPTRAAQTGGNLRQAVKSRLAEIDLNPPGIPPQAILVVRRLEDPLPGRFQSGRTWERAFQTQLQETYRHAARPAWGQTPAEDQAVVFADPAEMLVCLALDVQRGLVGARWWWRTLLRRLNDVNGLQSHSEAGAALAGWLEQHPHAVPALLARMERMGEAARLMAAFTPLQAVRVTQAVLRSFGLPPLPPGEPRGPAAPPPWNAPSAALPVHLGRERAALLGLALDLYALPALAAAPPYYRRLLAWWQSAEPLPVSPVSHPALTGHPSQPRRQPPPPAASSTAPQPPVESRPASRPPGTAADAPGTPPAAASPTALRGPHPPDSHLTPRAPARSGGLPDPDRAPASPPAPLHPQTAAPASPLAQAPTDHPTAPPSPEIAPPLAGDTTALPALEPTWSLDGRFTRLGGLLYLTNLFTALDLPACCETGWRLSSGVGAWGLLEAIGRELLGEAIAGYEDDPLWAALAALDQRPEGAPPGFRLPRARPRRLPPFALPAGWLAGLPNLPLQPLPRARAAAIRRAYPPLLAGWLVRALSFIEARLVLGLRLARAQDIPAALLLLPARVYLSPTQIDLVTSLENISLPARLAGLDRDPGWLPLFGREVYFHFEP